MPAGTLTSSVVPTYPGDPLAVAANRVSERVWARQEDDLTRLLAVRSLAVPYRSHSLLYVPMESRGMMAAGFRGGDAAAPLKFVVSAPV